MGEGAAGCLASNHRGNANEKRFVTMNSTRFSRGQCREGLGKDLPPPFGSITSPRVLRIKTGIILARVQEMFTRTLLVEQNIKFNATNGHWQEVAELTPAGLRLSVLDNYYQGVLRFWGSDDKGMASENSTVMIIIHFDSNKMITERNARILWLLLSPKSSRSKFNLDLSILLVSFL